MGPAEPAPRGSRIFGANHFLVELADAGFGDLVHQLDALRNGVLGNAALLGDLLELAADGLRCDRLAGLGNHQRQRPLAPALIRHADHGSFGNPRHLEDEPFEFDGRDPLAAALDHVLQAVGDAQIAVRIDDAYIASVQPAAFPELLGIVGIVQIALREPGRAHHDLALAFAVMWQVVHVAVDDANLHQRHRATGLAALLDLTLDVPVQHMPLQEGDGQDRAGLGHAVAGED